MVENTNLRLEILQLDKDLDISNLEFNYIDKTGFYTKNTQENKTARATNQSKILNGMLQLIDNMNRIIRQLNAYDSSSILIAESNWMKRNHFKKYTPSENAPKKVLFGQVCTIDYGKTYKGEIGYIHPGLCVGKKNEKYLIIPMTTGKTWRDTCYHPVYNPNMTKENRQCCINEGFEKDGVLLMNDSKFISGGRILELHEIIQPNILQEIQEQLFYIFFPHMYSEYSKMQDKITHMQNTIDNTKRQVSNLKDKNEKLSKRICDLEMDNKSNKNHE